MRKKIISMLLASMMILSMALTGCGNNESGTADTVDGTQTTSAAAEGDLTDIKMAYMIFNTAAPDMGLVQDEINKISEKEIGVHVTIEPIAVGDYATQVNLMFASGEELDIVQALTTNFTAWYANGSLTPIDSELKVNGMISGSFSLIIASAASISSSVFMEEASMPYLSNRSVRNAKP